MRALLACGGAGVCAGPPGGRRHWDGVAVSRARPGRPVLAGSAIGHALAFVPFETVGGASLIDHNVTDTV